MEIRDKGEGISERKIGRGVKKRDSAWEGVYFFSVGAGFMFVEIYFIKIYGLLFADPVISFSVVLAGILVFSGMGGWLSERMGRGALLPALGMLTVLLSLMLFSRTPLLGGLLGLPAWLRYSLAVALLFPPGVLMGIPFPLAMARLVAEPSGRVRAWAVNGCASVLTAVGAAWLALNPGVDAVMACGILAYAGAAAGAWRACGGVGAGGSAGEKILQS